MASVTFEDEPDAAWEEETALDGGVSVTDDNGSDASASTMSTRLSFAAGGSVVIGLMDESVLNRDEDRVSNDFIRAVAASQRSGKWMTLLKLVPMIASFNLLDTPLDSHPILLLTALQTILFDDPGKNFMIRQCARLPSMTRERVGYRHYLNSQHALWSFRPCEHLSRSSFAVDRPVARCGLMNTLGRPCALIRLLQVYSTDPDFRRALIEFLPDAGMTDAQDSSRSLSFLMHLRLLMVQIIISAGRALDPKHVVLACVDPESGLPFDMANQDPRMLSVFENIVLEKLRPFLDPYAHAFYICSNPLYRPGRFRTKRPSEKQQIQLEQIAAKDPLQDLTPEETSLLWEFRYHLLSSCPETIGKILMSVDWKSDLENIREAYRLLHLWPRVSTIVALELLDFKYVNPQVRSYAVDCLSYAESSDIIDFLPQLIQVMKFETHAESALSRFLMKRSGKDLELGHYFFWSLKSQCHPNEPQHARYQMILDLFLRYCGTDLLKDLTNQQTMTDELVRIAEMVKDYPLRERKPVLEKELEKMGFPPYVRVPLSAKVQVTGLNILKCKTMDSKKVPLWLNFKNAVPNSPSYLVIFKAGDDLRQDLLTLQLLTIMDKIWKRHGLDLRMIPYGCVATGDQTGFIEVVVESDTCAHITATMGGGAKGAYDKTTFEKWLRQHNRTFDEYCTAVDNFTRSCAAYAVATYVLGIGDRHNDNIMIQKSGKLFHIDFGHFLGNVKSKFGFKRERAPFVFTPDMAFVMGGEGSTSYNEFERLSCEAYNILRKYAHLFINLFSLMLSTGLPELQNKDDIQYLRNALQLGKTDKQASDYFRALIRESLHSKATIFNFYVHILAHSK